MFTIISFALLQNEVQISILIIEIVTILIALFFVLNCFEKAVKRKVPSAYYLSFGTLFYLVAVICISIGNWMDYFTIIPRTVLSHSAFMIALAYCFTSISNIFLFLFANEIYLFKGKKLSPLIVLLNTISIGLIAPNISTDFEIFQNSFPFLVYHCVCSLLIILVFAVFGFKKATKIEDKLSRIGFLFIGLFGIFMSLYHILFIFDFYLENSLSDKIPILQYLLWVFAILGIIAAYFGFLLPQWLRRIL